METTKRKLTEEEIFTRFEQMADGKNKRQRQFEEDCQSGKTQEKLKNVKRVLCNISNICG